MTDQESQNPYEPTSIAADRRSRFSPLVGCLLAAGLVVAITVAALMLIRFRRIRLLELEVQRARQAEIQAREYARQSIEKALNE